MNREDKTMLALAVLAYRGFGKQSEAAIDRALRDWLPKVAAEGLGEWELVWGPAAFRAPASLVDDAMMYVVRQRDGAAGAPPRFVLAIRGTNPVSLFDWVFGDLWVRRAVDWAADDATEARVSASTALGLAIAQHLAAEVPPTEGARLARFADELASAFQGLARALPEWTPDRIFQKPGYLTDQMILDRLDVLTGAAGKVLESEANRRFLDLLDNVKKPIHDAIGRRVFDRLLDRIAAAQGPGETLLAFLNRVVEPNAGISITGHSKGGALAIAIALWLEEAWAPQRQVRIDCFSFAGPAAGNAAFARRYNSALAARTRRIVNRLDIVPQAWVPDDLRTLQQFYPLLGPALMLLINEITPLDYVHVGGEVVEISSERRKASLIQEAIHQHLDAYLTDAAFSQSWNAQAVLLEP